MCIFICYDQIQKQFFNNHGLYDVVYGLHPKTLRKFWIFERTEQFNKYFEEWLKK